MPGKDGEIIPSINEENPVEGTELKEISQKDENTETKAS